MSLVFKSHGKLLISGEYLVLKGAKALCIPTNFFQTLSVKKSKKNILNWKSYNHNNELWFELKLNTHDLKVLSEENKETLFLKSLLENARNINPEFLKFGSGYNIESKMNFNKNWGLGSSSTLINNISQWAGINPFSLLWSVSNGSGYDVASCLSKGPIIYKVINKKPDYDLIEFKPLFHQNLFFIYMNKKKQTESEVNYFNNNVRVDKKIINIISSITNKMIKCENLESFQNLIFEHEKTLSKTLKKEMVKEVFFNDYRGEIKSLGAWGGDFILAAGPKDSKKYFEEKGFKTVFSFNDMLKNY